MRTYRAVALTVTTVLAFTQGGSPKALTLPQVGAQLVVWAGLFGFGLFLPDFGDTEDSELSFLTQVFGRSDALFEAGFAVALAFGVLVVVGYLVLLVLLIGARRRPSGAAA